MNRHRAVLGLLGAIFALCAPVAAPAKDILGPVTGQPMPRYIAIKANKANARRGPSKEHKIDWVYQRRNLPVQVVAESGHWRKVVDSDGEGGWIHYSLLTGVRHVLVTDGRLSLRYDPLATSQSMAILETGVIAKLEKCQVDWCAVVTGDHEGWLRKSGIWGVTADEIFD